jgi:hypothetical protein
VAYKDYNKATLFGSTKFKRRILGFEVVAYRQGLELIRREWQSQ